MGFGFWNQTAGFDINLHLIPYSALSTYGHAFWVGLLNTLLVAAICIPLATPARVRGRRRPPVAELAPVAVRAASISNVMRNTPLLLQLLFWYNAVLKSLPGPRQSMSLGGLFFLNNRGLFLPRTGHASGGEGVLRRARPGLGRRPRLSRSWARRRQSADRGADAGRARLGGACSRPACGRLSPPPAAPFSLDVARLAGFNLKGGIQVIPELAALVFGLVTYTVRLHRGDRARRRPGGARAARCEAAAALGLHRGLANAARRRPSGHAPHRSAADVAISQHRQELVARGVHRLSRTSCRSSPARCSTRPRRRCR